MASVTLMVVKHGQMKAERVNLLHNSCSKYIQKFSDSDRSEDIILKSLTYIFEVGKIKYYANELTFYTKAKIQYTSPDWLPDPKWIFK